MMLKKERIQFVIDELEKLYPVPPIPLDHQDAFTLLIAVLLSAQTTDKKVNQVTPELFAKAANAKAMSLLEVDEIKYYIREIGLSNTKAKNIKRLSEILIEKYDGEVPESFEEMNIAKTSIPWSTSGWKIACMVAGVACEVEGITLAVFMRL